MILILMDIMIDKSLNFPLNGQTFPSLKQTLNGQKFERVELT